MAYDENGDWIEEEDDSEEEAPPPAFAEPWDEFFANIPERAYSDSVVSEMTPPPQQAAPQAAQYAGEAFPGLPVIQEGGQNYYNGERMVSEEAAMQARARHAEASPEVQQQMAARGRQQQQTSIDIQNEIARLTPSPADRRAMTQLQNGRERLRRDRDQGLISQQQFDQMDRMIGEKQRPQMMTMQQLNGARRALELQVASENFQHQQQMRTRANEFTAAHAPGTTIPIPDPANPGQNLAQVFLDGQGRPHIIPVRPPAAAARPGGAGRASGGGGQATPASILQALRPSASTGESGGGLAAVPTDSQIDQQVDLQERVQSRLEDRQAEHARLQPGGPAMFDPPSQPLNQLSWTEIGQQLINAEAGTANQGGQVDRERAIRAIGGRLRAGATTGQLTPEQQQTLQRIGYYHGEFQPALDRELGRIENPPGVREGDVTVTRRATEAEKDAARGIRDLLGRYGTAAQMQRDPNAWAQFQGHLAAIRVFNWGRSEEEQRGGRRAPNDPPARQSPPRRQGPDPLGQQLSQQSQYRS